MNTNYRSIQLRSGQTLAVDRRGSGTLFLTEGEVLLQTPPEWLGDTVFQAPPARIAAPAALPRGQVQSITALGGAKVHLEEAASFLEKFSAACHAIRLQWSRAGIEAG